MSIYSSIYIPRIDSEHNEESISYYMMEHCIGIVSHIDFTPINQKPGFVENVNQVVKSAFVHFSDPWLCTDKLYYYQSMTHIGNTDFWNTIATGKPYKIQISDNEYWLCLKNKNIVQRTMMNIHQVVENGRHLEKLLEAQAKKIAELEDKLNKYQYQEHYYNRSILDECINLKNKEYQYDVEMIKLCKSNVLKEQTKKH